MFAAQNNLMSHPVEDRLRVRLGELRQEYERGEKMIAESEMQVQSLKESLLRISGAIMVLEEEIKLINASAAKAVTEPAPGS